MAVGWSEGAIGRVARNVHEYSAATIGTDTSAMPWLRGLAVLAGQGTGKFTRFLVQRRPDGCASTGENLPWKRRESRKQAATSRIGLATNHNERATKRVECATDVH